MNANGFMEASLLTALGHAGTADGGVERAALAATRALCRGAPEQCPLFLPALVHRLEALLGDDGRRRAPQDPAAFAVLAELLETLAAVGAHDFAVGMVGKVFGAMGEAGERAGDEAAEGVRLRALAVRCLLRLWEANDKAFPFLKAAVLDRDAAARPLLLRLARALALRGVCALDSSRGVELVTSIQVRPARKPSDAPPETDEAGSRPPRPSAASGCSWRWTTPSRRWRPSAWSASTSCARRTPWTFSPRGGSSPSASPPCPHPAGPWPGPGSAPSPTASATPSASPKPPSRCVRRSEGRPLPRG